MANKPLQIHEIFNEAIGCESAEGRRRFLDEACASDLDARQRVESLLRAHAEAGGFFGGPNIRVAATFPDDAPELLESLGTMIGPYKLREVLGEGGMGIVYVAEQEKPIRRKVALKIVKPGMDTREVIARFEAERQALALMDHPNIAKVLDAGTTDMGRPYFVMELVRGLSITDYCDRASVNLRERLELFVRVCHAVEHAHRKGVIHRDLKPSNLMVTLHDSVPVPKVIDFGVAKAINQRLSEHTVYTRHAQMVGTPMYMSPEQVELSGFDVDPRSDVYSLGVLLYELLTGTTPFDKETFSKVGLDEVRRIIREDEPPCPSHRVSTLAARGISTVSKDCGVDLRHFGSTLRGDLDWIVMKAIEKDRRRRYESADAFAADVQRYLEDRPIEARSPTLAYRLLKFVRRQRRPLSAVAVLVAALITGVISAAVIVVVKDREGRETGRIRVPEGGSVSIAGEKMPAAALSASRSSLFGKPPLSGLLSSPQEFPGLGRWQLITRSPRARPQHNWTLAWSPDSRFVVFGEGNDARVYSIPDFQLTQVLAGHKNAVICVDWSPDGKQIASASADNTIRLWDAETGVPGPILIGHRDLVGAVAWHPDSRRLASGSRDNTVRLWTTAGTPGRVLHGHTCSVSSVAWRPDGAMLASAGDGDGIRLWDADGKPAAVIDAKTTLRSIAWSPDGKQLLASQIYGPSSVRTWNPDGTPGLTLKGHTNLVVSTAWSPDGSRIVSGSWDGTTRLWNADGSPGPGLVSSGNFGAVHSAKFSPDGQWIATGRGDKSIRLLHPDGKPGPTLNGSTANPDVSWKPDGRDFALSINDQNIRICSADGDESKVFEDHGRSVRRADWSPDGRQIASVSKDGSIRLWNVHDGSRGPVFPNSGLDRNGISTIKWSPNGRQIAFRNSDSLLRIWNADGTAGPVLEGHQNAVYGIAWNPLDGRLASASSDGTVRLWRADGAVEDVLIVGQMLASVAWKPDGTQLASGCEDGTIQIWQATGQTGRLLKGHTDRVTTINWSSDGQYIASGSRDNVVRIWDSDGEPLFAFHGHAHEVRLVSWRPHSTQLLSAANDATVRLWDVESRQPIWILLVFPDKQVIKCSFNGSRLSGDEKLYEREVAYIIEKPTGAMEIVPPSEFERRTVNK